jgi:hypothetical protein
MKAAIGDIFRRAPLHVWQGGLAGLAVLFGLALGLRLIGLSKGIWLDEQSALNRAFHNDILGILLPRTGGADPPLYYILLHLLRWVGTVEWPARLLSVAFGFATVVIMALWLRRPSRLASYLVAVVLATTPVMLRYSQEIRPYALLMFATACAYLFADRVSRRPPGTAGFVGLVLSLTVAVSAHMTAVFLLPAILVFISLSRSPDAVTAVRRSLAAMVFPGALFLFYYFVYLKVPPEVAVQWIPEASADLVLSTFRYLFGASATAWSLQGPSPVQTPAIHYGWLILPTILVITLVWGRQRPGAPLLVSAMVFWLALIAYSHIGLPIFWYRTALPGLIPFVGAVALGAGDLRPRWLQIGTCVAVAALSAVYATRWAAVEAWQPIEEWRQVSRRIAAEWAPNSAVVFYPAYVAGPIRYYVPGIRTAATAQITQGAGRAQVDVELGTKVSASNRDHEPPPVFLVVRADLTAQKTVATYEHLAAALKSQIAVPRALHFYLIACADVSIRSDLAGLGPALLAALEREFGPPESYENFGSYSSARFRIAPPR